jgi:hypothetical protein
VFVLTYAVSAIAAGTFRNAAPTRLSGWIPGIKWIAPVSFVLSTEIGYWSGWSNLRPDQARGIRPVGLIRLVRQGEERGDVGRVAQDVAAPLGEPRLWPGQ